MTTLDNFGVAPPCKLLEADMPDGTHRWITMTAAYDLRKAPDGKNYGIHGSEMRFGVKRGEITVTLCWMMPFFLPHIRNTLPLTLSRDYDGLGSIDYHSPVPLYPDQIPVHDCQYTGGDCYCDGTSLGASELFDKAVADPSEIWKTLISWLEDTERRVKEQKEDARNFS